MGYSIQKLIDNANAEDGYLEKKKNCPKSALYEKVGNYVGDDNWVWEWQYLVDNGLPNYQGSYWCIASIFAIMIKTFGLKGAQELCLQKCMINCQETYNLFKAKKQIYTQPNLGDILLFWNGSRFHHAELVTSVKGDTVKTVGFNTSAVTTTTVYNGGGCRKNKTYSLTALLKAGDRFARPNYGSQITEGWVSDSKGKKYMLSDGTYVVNQWKYINSKYYVFDASGYQVVGWFKSGNQWYYMNPEMVKGWKEVGHKWYFMDNTGEMHTGWLQYDNNWYYLDEDGVMTTGSWKKLDDIYYAFKDDGVMLADEWFKSDGKWYYLTSTGAMATNQWRQNKDGKYYYLKSDGSMATNCLIKDKLENVYYFVGEDGVWDETQTVSNAELLNKYPVVE